MKKKLIWMDGKQYPFRRTSGIKPDVNDFPPAESRTSGSYRH